MILGKKKGLWGVLGWKDERVGIILGKNKGWVMGGIGRERRNGGGDIGKEERVGYGGVLGGKEVRVGYGGHWEGKKKWRVAVAVETSPS